LESGSFSAKASFSNIKYSYSSLGGHIKLHSFFFFVLVDSDV